MGGDDTSAAVCFQRALRCSDIRSPENDALGVFYADPNTPLASSSSSPDDKITLCHSESSETWAELAECYRQLGKYSAALRAYEASYDASGGNLSPEVLCAWARVDLDLGLYDLATEKCAEVLLSSVERSGSLHRMAAYIGGEASLLLARSCIHEGKFGCCLGHLEKGI